MEHVTCKNEFSVVMMGDDPAYWKEVVNKLKRDPRLTTVQKIEDGEEHEMWMWRETRIPGNLRPFLIGEEV